MRSDAPSDASGSDVGSATASDSHEGRLAKRAKTSDAVEPWSEAAGSLVHGALQSMEQRYLFLLRTSTPGKVIEDMQKVRNSDVVVAQASWLTCSTSTLGHRSSMAKETIWVASSSGSAR